MIVANRALAVFLVDGDVIALQAECPHEGGPIHEGTIERGRVVCPWHGHGFELQTGQCDFDHSLYLGRYQTFVKQGEVWVDLREQISPPAKGQK